MKLIRNTNTNKSKPLQLPVDINDVNDVDVELLKFKFLTRNTNTNKSKPLQLLVDINDVNVELLRFKFKFLTRNTSTNMSKSKPLQLPVEFK